MNLPNVIIRLQKLPWEAQSADVREFFRGLNIPEGGVHIVGGRDGDAFIAFSTDEDARQAMRMDGKRIKNAKIKLLLSSRVEMHQVIEKARVELQQNMNPNNQIGNDGKEKSVVKRRRSRSRSRSGERHRRSRSRSADRNRSGKSNPTTKTDAVQQPPPQAPTAPISGFSSFRNEPPPMDAGSKFNQLNRGVLDRNAPMPNMDGRFMDRSVAAPPTRPPPLAFSNRHHEFAPFPPQGENASFGSFPSKSRPQQSHQQHQSNVRMPSIVGDNFAGPPQLIRPGGMVPPPKFHEPSLFGGGGGPGIRQRMEPPRFDHGMEIGERRTMIQSSESSAPFTGHQQTAPPPSPAVNARASRRALLPAPPDEMADVSPNYSDQQKSKSFDAPPPNLNTDVQSPHQPPYGNRPQHFPDTLPRDWMIDTNSQQQPPPGFPFNPAPHGRPTLLISPNSSIKDSGLCVLLTAVPTSLQRYGAVREFFHPLNLEGPDKIKIVVDETGQRTNQIYCKFLTIEDADLALTYTGREKIYIRACTEVEFDKAIDGGLGRPRSKSKERESEGQRSRDRDDSRQRLIGNADFQDGSYIVEISNIPYKAVQADLRNFLGRYNPMEIRRLYKHHAANGKIVTSDTAYAIFSNERDAAAVLRIQDRRIMERDLRLSRSSTEAMDDAFQRAPPAPPEAVDEWVINRDRRDLRDRFHIDHRPTRVNRPPSLSPPPTRLLPYNQPYQRPHSPFQRPLFPKIESKQENSPVAESTPSSTFQFVCVCMKGVAMNATNRDVASFFAGLNIAANGIRILKSTPGVAYVEFATTNDCEQATTKDRSYIGTQMVMVRPCSKDEMMEAVHKQLTGGGVGGGGNSPSTQAITNSNNMTTSTLSPSQNQQFFGNNRSAVNQNPPHFFGNPTSSAELQQHGTMENSQTSLLYLQQLAALAKQEEEAKAKNQQENANKNGNYSSPQEVADMIQIDPEVVCNIGVPGCVAVLHNLPPKITLEEICQLFQGYQLVDDSVRMHYSNTGEPTGDCLLAFASPRDAQAAVSALSGSMIGGQMIRMYVLPA